jgi:dephospho-CoA kinase
MPNMKNIILGIAGKKRSGKDTIGNYLINNYGYIRYAFGDPVKEVCKILFGFNNEQLHGEKKELVSQYGISPREAFQKIGTEFGRVTIHDILPSLNIEQGNLWIEIFNRKCNEIRENEKGKTNIIITDVRFENEVEAIKKQGGKIIFIESIYADINDTHESENSNLKYDFLINNNGTKKELYSKIDNIILDLNKEDWCM